MKSRVSVTLIGVMAVALLGALVFTPTPASAKKHKFKDKDLKGRYVCQLQGVDSDVDAALLRFVTDGKGGFKSGNAVEEDDPDCPYELCTGTSCGDCSFEVGSSYSVNSDGT